MLQRNGRRARRSIGQILKPSDSANLTNYENLFRQPALQTEATDAKKGLGLPPIETVGEPKVKEVKGGKEGRGETWRAAFPSRVLTRSGYIT